MACSNTEGSLGGHGFHISAAQAHPITPMVPGQVEARNDAPSDNNLIVVSPSPLQVLSAGAQVSNILIFGETGTGKSSLINMLATADIAEVSNDALGCTFGSVCHTVSFGGVSFKLWDTAGLNEGEHGSVSEEQAIQNLQNLVHRLNSDGVSLLVYCIRGTRFRDILQTNYEIFYGIICQRKVPIVVVVTGLENEDPMESWWGENGPEFEKRGMMFAGHACVTTARGKQLKSGGHRYDEEYEVSREVVKELIRTHCSPAPWKIDEKVWLDDMTTGFSQYHPMERASEVRIRDDARGRTRLLSRVLELLFNMVSALTR